MQQKYVPAQESDTQQLALLARIIAEGKFEIKGDAILTVAGTLRYLAQLTDRFKNAAPVHPTPVAALEAPEAKVEVDTSNVRKGKRK